MNLRPSAPNPRIQAIRQTSNRSIDGSDAAARYAISAVFFVFGADVGAWFPHIPDVKIALGLSQTRLGEALLFSGFGAIVAMPFTGILIHRFGSRHVSIAAGALSCFLIPWLVREQSFIGLAVNLFILGTCYSCLDVAMNAHSVAVQARHGRPILSSVHGFFSIGGFAGSAGAALAAKAGLSVFTHLCLNSASMLLLIGASAPFLLPTDVDKDAEGPKFVIPRGVLLIQGLLCLCAFVGEGGLLEWVALYLRSSLRATAAIGAIGAGLISFAMAAARFGGDPVVARFGYRRVLVASGLIAAAGVLLAVSVPDPVISILAFSISALGVSNMVPILFAAAGTVPGVPAGTGLAAVSTCGYAGFLLGPPAIGAIADRASLGVSLGLLSLLGLTVTVLARSAVPSGNPLPSSPALRGRPGGGKKRGSAE